MRFVVYLTALSCGASAGATDPVAEFKANFPPFARGTFTAVVRVQPDTPPTSREDREYAVHLDPPRWKVAIRSKGTSLVNGKPATRVSRSERVEPGVGMLAVSADDQNRALSGVAAYVKPLPPDKAKESGSGPFNFVIDTRLIWNDQQSLARVLDLSQVTVQPGRLGSKDVVVVTATGPWGRHTLWLDPTQGHLPLRVVQEKAEADRIEGGQPLRSELKDPNERPPVRTVKATQQFDITRVELVAGRRMVTSFTRRADLTYSDGSQSGLTETVLINNVRPVQTWDKDPFVVTTSIPDGTQVTALDDQPIEYVWRGGRPVKAVDPRVVSQAAGQAFVPPAGGWGRWGGWAVGGGLTLAAAGALWVLTARARRDA